MTLFIKEIKLEAQQNNNTPTKTSKNKDQSFQMLTRIWSY